MRIKELRYWVQKVLPLVYDDSLSYYELLNRVVVKLNEVIELANGIDEKITEEVNSIMNEWLEDGTFQKLINQEVLTDLNNKIDSTIEDVGNLEETVGDLDERVDALESSPSTVVTPQSVGYPESKTADEAFEILAGFTDRPIVIPEGNYNLSEEHRLNNVVLDMGTYTNFVPMYKRKNMIDLQSVGAGKLITLPVVKSYAEAMCYLDGFFYACVFSFSEGENYIVKYNSDFVQVGIAYIPASITENAPANIYTDGEYIYVDFVAATCKYTTQLNLVTTIRAAGIWFTGYFNGSFWGVNMNVNASIVTVYKLDNGFNILESHPFNFGYPAQDAQSMTIHNGLIYVTTTNGYFAVIDMFDWSYELIYYNSQLEIENITFVGNQAWFCGSDIGITGQFRVGAFNGGQTFVSFNRYTIDGNSNWLNYGAGNKFGIYDFNNFDVGGFGTSGKLIFIDDITYAKIGHYLFTRNPDNGQWLLCGADGSIKIAQLAANLEFICRPNGTIELNAYGYTQGNREVTITRDNTDIFKLAGVSLYQDRTIVLLGREDGNGSAGASMAALRAIITRTAIYLRPTVIAGNGTNFLYVDHGAFCS